MARLLIVHDHPHLRGAARARSQPDRTRGRGPLLDGTPGAAGRRDGPRRRPDEPGPALDINTAPLVGLALTEALLERDPNERVLLYANIEGQEYVDSARRVGAAGYLSEPGWLQRGRLTSPNRLFGQVTSRTRQDQA